MGVGRKKENREDVDYMAVRLGGACYVCDTPYHNKYGKTRVKLRWSVHHIWYALGDKMYDDFSTRRAYWKYLRPQVEERGRDGFILLCGKHHKVVEWMAQMAPFYLRRLVRAAERSRYGLHREGQDHELDKEHEARREQDWAMQLRDA